MLTELLIPQNKQQTTLLGGDKICSPGTQVVTLHNDGCACNQTCIGEFKENERNFLSTLMGIAAENELAQQGCLAELVPNKEECVTNETKLVMPEPFFERDICTNESQEDIPTLNLKSHLGTAVSSDNKNSVKGSPGKSDPVLQDCGVWNRMVDTDSNTKLTATDFLQERVINPPSVHADHNGIRVMNISNDPITPGHTDQRSEASTNQVAEQIVTKTLLIPRESFPEKDLAMSIESRQVPQKAVADIDKEPGNTDKTFVISDKIPLGRGAILKSELNPQELGETVKNAPVELANQDRTSRLKNDPQDLKSITAKMVGLDGEQSPNKALTIESANGDSASSSSYSQSSDKTLEIVSQGKDTETIGKPFQSEVLNQIVKKAVLNLKNGQTAMKIDLKPEFLGHLRMRVTTENHQVIIRILTEVPQVKEIIENNINQLKADLQTNGLEMEKLDVFVARDSDQHGSNSFNGLKGESGDAGDAGGHVVEENEEADQLAEEGRGSNLVGIFA